MNQKLTALVGVVAFLVPLASKGCEASGGGSKNKPPEMILGNGGTRITNAMVGRTYHSKGPTDTAKRKHLLCEWRVINKGGKGDHFGITGGEVSVTFRQRNVGGVFHTAHCRVFILRQPYA